MVPFLWTLVDSPRCRCVDNDIMPMVDVLMRFIDLGGRRCDVADRPDLTAVGLNSWR